MAADDLGGVLSALSCVEYTGPVIVSLCPRVPEQHLSYISEQDLRPHMDVDRPPPHRHTKPCPVRHRRLLHQQGRGWPFGGKAPGFLCSGR